MLRSATLVESVRLDPELRQQLLTRAEADHISIFKVIRTAVRQYLSES